ncbi:hypothetical protein ACP70R_043743 [Stipagrostis hirtigluma subsp. patula]
MMATTTKQPETKAVALLCLQAQHVAGLPAAAEGRRVLLHLVQQQQQVETTEAAAARCTGGVAAFHDQVILLHCAPLHSVSSVVVAVSCRHDRYDDTTDRTGAAVRVDLTEQLRRPSPSALTFVLTGGATAGAVLSLTLHHRLISRPNRRCSACLPLPDRLLGCLRMRTRPGPMTAPAAKEEEDEDDGHESSSSGFITIEKGTISRRRPPSDNLLTTDDDEGEDKPTMRAMALAEEKLQLDVDSIKVENEFLAMLEADHHDFDLDTLIKDAEAELAAAADSRL